MYSPPRHSLLAFGVAAVGALVAAQGGLARQLPQGTVAPPGREAMYRRAFELASLNKGGVVRPRWLADRHSFAYAENAPNDTVFYKVDPTKNSRTEVFDIPRLRSALATTLGHQPPYKGVPFETFSFVDGDRAVRFSVAGREFLMPLATYTLTEVTPPSRQEAARSQIRIVREPALGPTVLEQPSPDGRWILGERDHNVYARSTYDGREVLLTTDGVDGVEWRTGGLWAPDSKRVAVFKRDDREVFRQPIVHFLKQNEEATFVRFTKAGDRLPLTHLYVIDLVGRTQIKAQVPDDEDRYLVPVAWLPDGSELLFYQMSRNFKKLQLLAMEPRTGTVRLVLEEKQDTFIKGLSQLPRWETHLLTLLDGGKQFLFISERDGWDHLYLYSTDGKLVRRLTSGTFPVLRVVDVDLKAGWVYFLAHAEPRPYDTHLYRINLDGTRFKRLTEGDGTHDPVFSPDKGFFLDSHSSFTRPRAVDLRAADGRLIQTVSKADTTALTTIKYRAPEEVVAKAADGKTNMYGIVLKPFDFDPARKYPVIQYISGGPHTLIVINGYNLGRNAFFQSLAELGAVVVVFDRPGTIRRGKAFQDTVYRNFGKYEVPDNAAALNHVAGTRPYMDMSRVAAVGDGWGGYHVINALLTANDTYRVGVSVMPAVTIDDMHGPDIEPYMDLPQNNRAGYAAGSLLQHASKLRGKLLIIHGTDDISPAYSNAMKMSEAFIRAGKFFHFIVMPGMTHEFHGAGLRYYFDAQARYLSEHLIGTSGVDETAPNGSRR